MDNRISRKNYTLIASMLFGLFFGAGNLIFPIIMGAKAGANVVPALIGMLVTADNVSDFTEYFQEQIDAMKSGK